MRDIIVTLIVFGGLPYALARPYIGIYLWSWIGYMNPHRLGWGFAADFPFAAIIGLATMVGMVFSKEPKRLPVTPVTVVLMIFIAWMAFTTIFATNSLEAPEQLVKVLKIQLMAFITMMLIVDRRRIEILVWVIVVSLGFYGVKGGVFTLVTGGKYMVLGPSGTFIGGNTSMALAEIMMLPLMRYLQMRAANKWVRRGLSFAMALTAVSIVGSYSRGAFLAGAAIAAFLIMKSKRRVALGFAMILLIPVVIAFMPSHYTQKMETIETFEEDPSALGRIGAWEFAYELAKQRFVGGGFEAFIPRNYQYYAPSVVEMLTTRGKREASNMPDAHSIYFEVLGEHGFVGLALFLLLGVLAWRTGTWVIRHSRASEELKWAADLAAMVQVCLIGYAVGGAFLGLAYFDFYYHLVAILVVLKEWLKKQDVLLEEVGGRDALGRPLRTTPAVNRGG
jgi:probable O-glycosylation ligase (exosortase A-associated)